MKSFNETLRKQNLAIAYKVEVYGRGALCYALCDSNIGILTDDGGISIYEKTASRNSTSTVELTEDEAFTLFNILKERYPNA